jgi:DNA-binding MarR family transcriptional regulator
MPDDAVRQCATTVMDTFHMVMRSVRPDVQKRPHMDLSMHQFRALITVEHHEGASLSLVSEHMGATLSSTSKLIDGLVERGYVRRETALDDRRKLLLALTDTGRDALASVHLEIISRLAEKLTKLSPSECAMIDLAMDVLRSAIISAQPAASGQPTETSE